MSINARVKQACREAFSKKKFDPSSTASEVILADAYLKAEWKRRKAKFHHYHHNDKSYCSECSSMERDEQHDWTDEQWLESVEKELVE